MKLHHTAVALALMGWYLMMPPNVAQTSCSCAGGFEGRIFDAWIGTNKRMDNCARWSKVADFEAPFSQWSATGSFDTYEQCEAQRGKNLLQAVAENPVFPGPPPMQQRCVAAADLKGT
ncbi:MAG: hypothetical protein ACLQAT_14860 [Candidatus Binataceae bacterium]